MNPELQRNIWLELTPGRLIAVPVLLGALFLTAALFQGADVFVALGSLSVILYYGFTVVWGTWLAARAVVGEIRERTWDGQRLSAISPWSMMWGKLFGSTIFAWYGGALCLALAFLSDLATDGPAYAIELLLWRAFLGVLAQSVTLLASLVALRRGMGARRVGTFFFQILGVLAAWSASSIWAWVRSPVSDLAALPWWGMEFDSRAFLLASLVVFSAWSLVGNHRLMRTELQVRNTVVVALAFLVFLLVYVAGFGSAASALVGERWEGMPYAAIAFGTAVPFAYLMAILDPKDFVLYRWMAAQLASGNLLGAVARMQSWMLAAIVATLLTAYLIVAGPAIDVPPEFEEMARQSFEISYKPAILASLFFLFRDLGIVLFFNASPGARRADMTAIAVIVLAYLLPTAFVTASGAQGLAPLFSPDILSPNWLHPVFPLVQAGLVWALVAARASRIRQEKGVHQS